MSTKPLEHKSGLVVSEGTPKACIITCSPHVYSRIKYKHFCITLGFVICKIHVAKPLDSINKCRKFLLLSQETFFCRNLKNYRMSFLCWCNVETASHPGLSCSKVARFESGFYSKNFSRAIFFDFWGTHLVDMFLSYLPVKQIWRKSAVWDWALTDQLSVPFNELPCL